MNSRFVPSAVRLVRRLKIDHATPHTRRHTVGSHLDRLGFELNEIGLALGHKARGVTAGYVHCKSRSNNPSQKRLICSVAPPE